MTTTSQQNPNNNFSTLAVIFYILLIVFVTALLNSCSKDDQVQPAPTPQPAPTTPHTDPCPNQAQFKNVLWKNIDSTQYSMKFVGDTTYYENDTLTGHYTILDNCSTVFVYRNSGINFYFRIVSVNADSLRIQNISGGLTPFSTYRR